MGTGKSINIYSLTMKHTELDVNQRKLLRLGVALMLIIFLIGYFLMQKMWSEQNNQVILQGSRLQVFDDTYTLKQYPDKVAMHYPYILIIQADKPLTTIYNLETKKKEKEIKDVLLDYYDGNIVYNKKETYLNDRNLGVLCESTFIKDQEVLCITKVSKDSVDNKLISINLKNGLQKFVYQSENVLTTVSVINNDIYVGEINIRTKQNYLSVNKKAIPINDVVSIIYLLKDRPHVASFRSVFNQQKESYYIIKESGIDRIAGDKIVFYNN